MGRRKLLQAVIAATLLVLSVVRCGTGTTVSTPEVPAPASTPEPSAMTPTPMPTARMTRYSDPYMGFAVEYPLDWEVTAHQESQNPAGKPFIGVEFRSNLRMGGEQVFGKYVIYVAVGEAAGTLTDTVELSLSPIVPEFRNQIERHCCLTVGGEPAMELRGFPWGRWGSRRIVVVHDGRAYWLTIYPYDVQFNTPSDIVARAAFDVFLRSFTFIPVTVLPTPTVTPVPTPTPQPSP